ncbi:hypothetical protein AOLI_G00324710 [Acnodon oligacanthus]
MASRPAPGRPRLDVAVGAIKTYLLYRMKAHKIPELFGVSTRTLRRRMEEVGLSLPSHYKLAMHAFGLLTSAGTLAELDQMLLSCTVLFSSPCSSENVEKHFRNLQTMLTAFGASPVNDSSIVAEDFEVLSKL